MTDNPTILFEKLSLAGWRQFDEVELELHRNLTVITGANGSGKTTILNMFARHFGWSAQYLSTPTMNEGRTKYSYLSGIFRRFQKASPNANPAVGRTPPTEPVGSLSYTNKVVATFSVPLEPGVEYELRLMNQQIVPGVSIPSHRPPARYQGVGNIPTNVMLPEQAYGAYHHELLQRYQGGHSQFSPTYRLKEALISMATFGAGNAYIQHNQEALDTFLGFIEVLREVLPKSLGFLDLSIRTPDVVLVTRSGEFLVDAASGGILAIIDLAWRIFLYSRRYLTFSVVIDEPENHLHPSMQRSLMGNLIRAFPGAQFIVATHSPFVVSSVKDSHVYVLNYRDSAGGLTAGAGNELTSRRVVSLKLDTINRAGSAGEILREVLGVRATIPEWVEESLSQIVETYRDRQITDDTLTALRSELAKLGYGELYPDALASLTEGR